MSMKQEIETWVAALQHYDNNEFEEAIQTFSHIGDTSKVLFNCGVIRATLGEHEAAVMYYKKALNLDVYLAIAYFQQGVSNFLVGNFEDAMVNFNDTLLYLRGNRFIDYDQLGLKFKLHAAEAIFNRGLCYVYLQQNQVGMEDLIHAAKEKAIPEHDVIDEAIKEKAEGYTVFSIPVGLVFRPSDAKVKNIRARDYLGKAREVGRAQPGFDTVSHRRNISSDNWARDDRPPETLSYAATHLVRPGLTNRSRQQSEPPIQRNLFPPTPPPDSDKQLPFRSPRKTSPDRRTEGRSRSLQRKPEPLSLGVAAFERPKEPAAEPPRRGTVRAASEQPIARHQDCRSQGSDSGYRRQTKERLFGSIDEDGQQENVARELQQQQHARAVSKNSLYAPLSSRSQRPELIQEEDEDEPNNYFHAQTGGRSSIGTTPEVREDPLDTRRGAARTTSRGPVQGMKIRIKAHLADDTRFVIIGSRTPYEEFIDQVAKKFTLKGGFMVKTRDEEGDMITMADQDDLDMAIAIIKDSAAKSSSDMGKMEIWLQLN